MKAKIALIAIIFLGLVASLTRPQPGCLDNSMHLKEKYDTKAYHAVECNCPCDTYAAFGRKSPDRNKCLECGHFHDAQPVAFIPKTVQAKGTLTAQESLKKLFDRHQERIKNTPNTNRSPD